MERYYVLRRVLLPNRVCTRALSFESEQPPLFYNKNRHVARIIGHQIFLDPTSSSLSLDVRFFPRLQSRVWVDCFLTVTHSFYHQIQTVTEYGGVSLLKFSKSKNGGGVIAIAFSTFLRRVLARGVLVHLAHGFQTLQSAGYLHGYDSISFLRLL